ncbi:MsnO8 family LLM class oxidoreductase [Corallococcus sp. M7]
MRLGILDFCSLRQGATPRAALYESVELAQHAEALGFSRYWLAEHHELTAAHHAPDMLAALIAGSTERIRVGVAGILLKLHSPMRVAKAFRLMETFFPDRIDLGVGAGGAEPSVMAAMRCDTRSMEEVSEEYPRRVAQLLELLRGESPLAFHPPGAPPVWLLGAARPFTAQLAARHGTCFGYSLAHVSSRDDPSVLDVYRSEFRPRPEQPQPQAVLAVTGLCAPTEAEARRRAGASGIKNGDVTPVIGDPRQCREQLEALAHRYGTQELVFLDQAPDAATRRECYALLSESLGLNADPAEED